MKTTGGSRSVTRSPLNPQHHELHRGMAHDLTLDTEDPDIEPVAVDFV
jgi:hypothetical protein